MNIGRAFRAFFRALKQQEEPHVESKAAATHLQLLSLMQHSGRLIDFLKEDLSPFTDAEVGAAARKLHSACSHSLEEYVTLRPVLQDAEGSQVVVPEGYDAEEVKVVGHVKGKPPYRGVLRHKGWRAHKLTLPESQLRQKREVISPAEVEVKG